MSDPGEVSDWLFDQEDVDDDDPRTTRRLLDELATRFGPYDGAGWAALGDHLENENFHTLAKGARARAAAAGWVDPPSAQRREPRKRRAGLPRLSVQANDAGLFVLVFSGGAALAGTDGVEWPPQPLLVAGAVPAVLASAWLWSGVRPGAWLATAVGLAIQAAAIVVAESEVFVRLSVWGFGALALLACGPASFRRPGGSRR